MTKKQLVDSISTEKARQELAQQGVGDEVLAHMRACAASLPDDAYLTFGEYLAISMPFIMDKMHPAKGDN